MKSPCDTPIRPNTISTMPNTFPAPAAMRVAQSRSPRQDHRTARKIRPPSSGKAGTRLKTANMKLSGAEIPEHAGNRCGAARGHYTVKQKEQNGCQQQTGGRPRRGHQQLVARPARLGGHFCNATKDEQGDAADRHAVMARDQRMGCLVEHDRQEQSDRCQGPHRPVARGREARREVRKYCSGQGPCDQRREQQPRGIHADLEAEQGKQLDAIEEDETPTTRVCVAPALAHLPRRLRM